MDSVEKAVNELSIQSVLSRGLVSDGLDEINIFKEKHNMSPIKFLNKLGIFDVHVAAAHCVHLDNEDIEIIKK